MHAFRAVRVMGPKPHPLEDVRGEDCGHDNQRNQTARPGDAASRSKCEEVIARDAQFVSPSYTRGYPLVAKSGRGAMVEDVDGNVFLDFAAGIAVVSTGHCHPRVVEAIQKQAAELIHMSGTDFYYPSIGGTRRAAGRRSLPARKPKKVYFGNSGTEAIEAAIKLARYHTRRDKIIAFHGCFHGRTLGALSLTASKAVQRKGFGALLAGVFHIPYPNSYRCPYGNPSPCTCVECGHVSGARNFQAPGRSRGSGGRSSSSRFRAKAATFPRRRNSCVELQRICRKHGILLVCDEVQSGMGRTGKWWACDHAGIEPDILCVAKGIASGMPLSATIARASLMDWKPGAHASTFGGNPVCVAAALATMDLLETQYIENARRVGEFLHGPHGGLARAAQNRRRRARQGPDDRRRNRARSENQGARRRSARRASWTARSRRACCCSAPAKIQFALRRRWSSTRSRQLSPRKRWKNASAKSRSRRRARGILVVLSSRVISVPSVLKFCDVEQGFQHREHEVTERSWSAAVPILRAPCSVWWIGPRARALRNRLLRRRDRQQRAARRGAPAFAARPTPTGICAATATS